MKYITAIILLSACSSFSQNVLNFKTISEMDNTTPSSANAVGQVSGFLSAGDGERMSFRYDITNALSTNAARRVSKNGAGRWVSYSRDFQILRNSPLAVYISPGTITYADGFARQTSESVVNLFPSNTNYIGIDIQDLSVHAFRRGIHSGMLWVGIVVTSETNISGIYPSKSFTMPLSFVESFKQKQWNRIIHLHGDSLTDGSGSFIYWRDLVFNSSYSSSNYNIPYLSGTTTYNYAQGSQTAQWGLMMCGKPMYQRSGQDSGGNTGVAFGNYQVTDVAGQTIPVEGTAMARNPDLATVSFGANGGNDNQVYLESIVRLHRKRGIPVLLITQNAQSSDTNTLDSVGTRMASMASAYGCAIADTWSYLDEARLNGQSVLTDTVHPNQNGHDLYAKAVRSVLNSYVQTPVQPTTLPLPQRLYQPDDTSLTARSPNYSESIWTPVSTTGTSGGAAALSDASRQPAVSVGGKSASTALYTLTSGQVIRYGHPLILAMGMVAQDDVACSYNITVGGVTVKSSSLAGGGSGQPRFYDLLSISECKSLYASFGLYAIEEPNLAQNFGWQIEVTSGTLKILGAVVHTWYRKEIPFESMRFNGTWGKEAGAWGAVFHHYSDTIGDTVSIPFNGSGIQVLLMSTAVSGWVDVRIDGDAFKSSFDLYRAAGGRYVWPGNAFPSYTTAGSVPFRGGSQPHRMAIRIPNVNGSASSPSGTSHRLAIVQATDIYAD